MGNKNDRIEALTAAYAAANALIRQLGDSLDVVIGDDVDSENILRYVAAFSTAISSRQGGLQAEADVDVDPGDLRERRPTPAEQLLMQIAQARMSFAYDPGGPANPAEGMVVIEGWIKSYWDKHPMRVRGANVPPDPMDPELVRYLEVLDPDLELANERQRFRELAAQFADDLRDGASLAASVGFVKLMELVLTMLHRGEHPLQAGIFRGGFGG